jgi:hypothetical protein
MTSVAQRGANEFVARVRLPAPPEAKVLTRDGTPAALAPTGPTLQSALDATKNQAAIVGSDVVSFVNGVTPERREAIVNSTLLAQLAATQKVGQDDTDQWYQAYFDVLGNIGWAIQDKGFEQYHQHGGTFETHKAILAVAGTLLGAAPAALAVIKTTLEALESMTQDDPWITLFNRESETSKAARFQIGLAEQAAQDQFLVTLMAFILSAKQTVTQVLFFKASKSDVSLQHRSSKITIDTPVLDGVRDVLRQKLVAHSLSYIKLLPDLP